MVLYIRDRVLNWGEVTDVKIYKKIKKEFLLDIFFIFIYMVYNV